MYYPVKSNRDYRIRMGVMRMLESMIGQLDDPEETGECIINEKRALREWAHRGEDQLERHTVKDYGMDGMVVRIELTGCESVEEAEEWFENCERIEYTYYPWDCTGQCSTEWHRIKQMAGGRYVCYHSIGRDV